MLWCCFKDSLANIMQPPCTGSGANVLQPVLCVRLQWVALPALPAAWAAFGALLMAAAALTQRLLQPRLYAHRPLPLFTGEFARWWLAQRLVGTVNLLFAEQLRGTPVLAWWFRMLVRACLIPH